MKQNVAYAIILCEFVRASITGVTYMDHFDFEQRYKDVDECNPLHWHPLHLPQECVNMFENLIRSRIKMSMPYRIVKAAQPTTFMYPYNYIYGPIYTTEYNSKIESLSDETKIPSQYEILYELLKQDVQDLPSVPFLGVSPYLGVMALYKQPVSYKTVSMIKKLAGAYDNSNLFTNMQSEIDKSVPKKKNVVKTHKILTNDSVVVDKILKENDAITLLKIKKFYN